MHERHTHREKYFEEQVYTTSKYVIPFLEQVMPVDAGLKVLEIGCGEGGNMKPFLDLGCDVTGIDLEENKIEKAGKFFADHPNRAKLRLICRDIYELDEPGLKFDLIILRDVIEHIHNQERFMNYVRKFLLPGGRIFFGFPPWQNPFGGHQQMATNKFLAVAPFIHLLPTFMYKGILKAGGESDSKIEGLLEIKDTRLTIERFNRILKKENFRVEKVIYYFINPNYEIKFKLKPRMVFRPITAVPVLRNFFITTCYYIVSQNS